MQDISKVTYKVPTLNEFKQVLKFISNNYTFADYEMFKEINTILKIDTYEDEFLHPEIYYLFIIYWFNKLLISEEFMYLKNKIHIKGDKITFKFKVKDIVMGLDIVAYLRKIIEFKFSKEVNRYLELDYTNKKSSYQYIILTVNLKQISSLQVTASHPFKVLREIKTKYIESYPGLELLFNLTEVNYLKYYADVNIYSTSSRFVANQFPSTVIKILEMFIVIFNEFLLKSISLISSNTIRKIERTIYNSEKVKVDVKRRK